MESTVASLICNSPFDIYQLKPGKGNIFVLY